MNFRGKTLLHIGVVTALFQMLGSGLYAGPTIVRDSRAQDTGTTPVLGRGYSISTNTFQSACLAEVVITEPSYDFQYRFEEAKEAVSNSTSLEGGVGGSYSTWWLQGQMDTSSKSASENSRTSHSIVVTLNMDTYYASVNEASTPLSEAAGKLLERDDVPGFFSACGPYYVRGINRNSQFVSLFTYETETNRRDTEFEASLKTELTGFAGAAGPSIDIDSKSTFSKRASKMNLTITTRGWGLGKKDDASLISYDLETFKAAITQAFISMQNPYTGKVVSLEIVPWVENAEFQRKLNIQATDENLGKEVPLYEKKDILTLNGEFLTEMNRATRARLDRFYRANMCRDLLLRKYTFNGKEIIEDYKKTNLRNHRLGPNDPFPIDLDKLLESVGDEPVEEIWQEYRNFAFGETAETQTDPTAINPVNAHSCVKKLMSNPDSDEADQFGRGIFLKRYYAHAECEMLRKRFVPPARPVIEDYCMPQLVNEL